MAITLAPISGPLGIKRARHLLRRLTYGASKDSINSFAGMDITTAINNLFSGFVIPMHPIALPDAWDRNAPADGQWVSKAPVDGEKDFMLVGYFKKWWLGQMALNNNSLEKLVFFLHTVITTKDQVSGGARAMYWQNYMFRQYLINDFANTNINFNRYTQLLEKICVDNSMISFLNSNSNVKSRPNENFGREFLELFSIGKGPEKAKGDYTNYTEDDIKAAAKVFTGWDAIDWKKELNYIDPDTGIPTGKVKSNITFNAPPSAIPSQRLVEETAIPAYEHDNKIKQFSADFGNKTVVPNPALLSGSSGDATLASARDEIHQLINIISSQAEFARYFVKKIYRFFVHWDLKAQSLSQAQIDEIESVIISGLANTFTSSGFRIRPVLEQLFSSEFFFAADPSTTTDDKFGSMIKSPIDITIGTLKYFKINFPAVNTKDFFDKMGQIESAISVMGLELLNPFDVAGYDPYHQEPYFSRNWITVNYLAQRYNFILSLFSEMNMWGFDFVDWAKNQDANFNSFATIPTNIAGKDYAISLIKYLIDEFLPLTSDNTMISDARINYFANYHLIGQPTGTNSSDFATWVNRYTNPAPYNKPYLTDLIGRLYRAILQSPEYQIF